MRHGRLRITAVARSDVRRTPRAASRSGGEAVHQEAARASWSLVEAMTKFDRSEDDPRDTELRRAEDIAQRLADRFPEDESMKAAVEEIKKTRERRAHSMKMRRRLERLP